MQLLYHKTVLYTHRATDNAISSSEPFSVVVDEWPVTEHRLFDITASQHSPNESVPSYPICQFSTWLQFRRPYI